MGWGWVALRAPRPLEVAPPAGRASLRCACGCTRHRSRQASGLRRPSGVGPWSVRAASCDPQKPGSPRSSLLPARRGPRSVVGRSGRRRPGRTGSGAGARGVGRGAARLTCGAPTGRCGEARAGLGTPWHSWSSGAAVAPRPRARFSPGPSSPFLLQEAQPRRAGPQPHGRASVGGPASPRAGRLGQRCRAPPSVAVLVPRLRPERSPDSAQKPHARARGRPSSEAGPRGTRLANSSKRVHAREERCGQAGRFQPSRRWTMGGDIFPFYFTVFFKIPQ